MVEIEIGVLCSQCLDRRISERKSLVRENQAWEKQRKIVAPESSGCSQPSAHA